MRAIIKTVKVETLNELLYDKVLKKEYNYTYEKIEGAPYYEHTKSIVVLDREVINVEDRKYRMDAETFFKNATIVTE